MDALQQDSGDEDDMPQPMPPASCPGGAVDDDEEGAVSFQVLRDGFVLESSIMPGLRDGYDVVCLWEIEEKHDKLTPPNALMLLDPSRYPTTSRAKKAVRRGLILKYRTTLPTAEDSAAVTSSGATAPKRRKQQHLVAIKTSTVLRTGDQLALQTNLGSGCYSNIPWDKPNFDLPVLYEDTHLAIVNKPAGVECYAKARGGHGKQTLRSALPYFLKPPAPGVPDVYRLPQAMHRLDLKTSGLVVVAKTKLAATGLSRSFAQRQVDKEYDAVVAEDDSVITMPETLGMHTAGLEQWSEINEPCGGKPSVSCWRLVESFQGPKVSFPSAASAEGELQTKAGMSSLRMHHLKLRPKTGRKHQLRLHCSGPLGCAIVGDDKYDTRSPVAVAMRKIGLLLNATAIRIAHPLYSHSDVPDDDPFLSKGDEGVVWVSARLDTLPVRFSELRDGGGIVVQQEQKRAKKIKKVMRAGATHVFSQGQAWTPDGVTICSFYNYGVCTRENCHWDHTHCHKCKMVGHIALSCPDNK